MQSRESSQGPFDAREVEALASAVASRIATRISSPAAIAPAFDAVEALASAVADRIGRSVELQLSPAEEQLVERIAGAVRSELESFSAEVLKADRVDVSELGEEDEPASPKAVQAQPDQSGDT